MRSRKPARIVKNIGAPDSRLENCADKSKKYGALRRIFAEENRERVADLPDSLRRQRHSKSLVFASQCRFSRSMCAANPPHADLKLPNARPADRAAAKKYF